MRYEEILSHFKVKTSRRDSAQCICPAHDDREASLTITRGENRNTLLCCHAGCETEKILGAVGLSMRDLFECPKDTEEQWRAYVEQVKKKTIEAVYHYVDLEGNYAFTRLRLSGKHFTYGRVNDGRFDFGLGGKKREDHPAVYCKSINTVRKAIEAGEQIFYCEGEKDVLTVTSQGLTGITCGSAKDWVSGCAPLFAGADVVILQDNDEPGRGLSAEVVKDLLPVAKSVKVVVPTPDIEHGDISDFLKDHTVEALNELIQQQPVVEKQPGGDRTSENSTGAKSQQEDKPVFVMPPKMSSYEKKEPEWLIPGYLPRSAISMLAAAGGSGKTTIETAFAAAVTSGTMPFICGIPEKFSGDWSEPGTVLFLSGEDFAQYTLRKRVEDAGGDVDRIYIVDPSNKDLPLYKFGGEFLEKAVIAIKPSLIIVDPLQSFLDDSVNMVARNQMRSALTTIAELTSRVGAATLIAVHTNKRPGVWGRERISDSSDIWDAARSVLMVDYTGEEGEESRYISHEKCNWSKLSQTAIFRIADNGVPEFISHSKKRDRDFQLEANSRRTENRAAPKRDSCSAFILETLRNGDMEGCDLQKLVIDEGWSKSCFLDARTELYTSSPKRIEKRYRPKQNGHGTTCFWGLADASAG